MSDATIATRAITCVKLCLQPKSTSSDASSADAACADEFCALPLPGDLANAAETMGEIFVLPPHIEASSFLSSSTVFRSELYWF